MSMPSVGATVGGRFDLRERVDSGGFATVYRAKDTRRGVDVAVKVPHYTTQDDYVVRKGFEQEVDALERLRETIQPTSIVRLIDANVSTDETYVALEFVDGPTVEDALSTRLKPGSKRALQVARAVCVSVATLHLNGWLHLDLKPENVILRPSGRPVLVDFSTAVSRTDRGETTLYPDGYKPPEQTPGGDETESIDVDAAADAYALGAVLYRLATGRSPPETAPSTGLTVDRSPSGWPDDVATVVRRATTPSKNSRYDTAVEVLGGLVNAAGLDGLPAGLHYRGLESGPTRVRDGTGRGRSDPYVLVAAGTTVGRRSATETPPDVWICDRETHISDSHFDIDRNGDRWVVVDRSLNGTYIKPPGGRDWTMLLNDDGYRELKRRGNAVAPSSKPPSHHPISDGTRIAPVDPNYGVELEFRTA